MPSLWYERHLEELEPAARYAGSNELAKTPGQKTRVFPKLCFDSVQTVMPNSVSGRSQLLVWPSLLFVSCMEKMHGVRTLDVRGSWRGIQRLGMLSLTSLILRILCVLKLFLSMTVVFFPVVCRCFDVSHVLHALNLRHASQFALQFVIVLFAASKACVFAGYACVSSGLFSTPGTGGLRGTLERRRFAGSAAAPGAGFRGETVGGFRGRCARFLHRATPACPISACAPGRLSYQFELNSHPQDLANPGRLHRTTPVCSARSLRFGMSSAIHIFLIAVLVCVWTEPARAQDVDPFYTPDLKPHFTLGSLANWKLPVEDYEGPNNLMRNSLIDMNDGRWQPLNRAKLEEKQEKRWKRQSPQLSSWLHMGCHEATTGPLFEERFDIFFIDEVPLNETNDTLNETNFSYNNTTEENISNLTNLTFDLENLSNFSIELNDSELDLYAFNLTNLSYSDVNLPDIFLEDPEPGCLGCWRPNVTVMLGCQRTCELEGYLGGMRHTDGELCMCWHMLEVFPEVTEPNGTVEPPMCTDLCEETGFQKAAMMGQTCYCATAEQEFNVTYDDGLFLENSSWCSQPCGDSYYNGIAGLCGGFYEFVVSVYQTYDMSDGAQGTYDPFRSLWWQTVGVEVPYFPNETTAPEDMLLHATQVRWFLHAVNVSSGAPVYPFHVEVEYMIQGLQYDLDASRLVGYTAPYWGNKERAARWKPQIQVVQVNSSDSAGEVSYKTEMLDFNYTDCHPRCGYWNYTCPACMNVSNITNESNYTNEDNISNITVCYNYTCWVYSCNFTSEYNETESMDFPEKELAPQTAITAFDSVNDVYYIAVADLALHQRGEVATEIFGISLRDPLDSRTMMCKDIPHRLTNLEVNAKSHHLYGNLVAINETGHLEWMPAEFGYSYLRTGPKCADASCYLDFNQDYIDNITSNLSFLWTFDNYSQARMEYTSRQESWDNKHYQVGGTVTDHLYNATCFVYKDKPDTDEPLRVMDLRPNNEDNQIMTDDWTFNFGALPAPALSMNLLNLDPQYSWHPVTRPISARFSMNRSLVYVIFKDFAIAGTQHFDTDGDTLPDAIDWSTNYTRSGWHSCFTFLAYMTPVAGVERGEQEEILEDVILDTNITCGPNGTGNASQCPVDEDDDYCECYIPFCDELEDLDGDGNASNESNDSNEANMSNVGNRSNASVSTRPFCRERPQPILPEPVLVCLEYEDEVRNWYYCNCTNGTNESNGSNGSNDPNGSNPVSCSICYYDNDTDANFSNWSNESNVSNGTNGVNGSNHSNESNHSSSEEWLDYWLDCFEVNDTNASNDSNDTNDSNDSNNANGSNVTIRCVPRRKRRCLRYGLVWPNESIHLPHSEDVNASNDSNSSNDSNGSNASNATLAPPPKYRIRGRKLNGSCMCPGDFPDYNITNDTNGTNASNLTESPQYSFAEEVAASLRRLWSIKDKDAVRGKAFMDALSCMWMDKSGFVMSLPDIYMLELGDRLSFQNDTIHRFDPWLDVWERPVRDVVSDVLVDIPDPLYPPVLIADSYVGQFHGWNTTVNSTPIDINSLINLTVRVPIELCQTVDVVAPESYYHGGAREAKWTWSLASINCSSGWGVPFEQNYYTTFELKEHFARISRTPNVEKPKYKGEDHFNASLGELATGCLYNVSLDLLGLWGVNTTIFLEMHRVPPSLTFPPKYQPPCEYECSPGTCEPPSQCVDGVCTCVEDIYGTFCHGICPPCEKLLGSLCDDGREGSGTCICAPGFTGFLCNEACEYGFGKWSKCEGKCDTDDGVRNRTRWCFNMITGETVDDDICLPPEIGEEIGEVCTPDPCPACGPPPETPGMNMTLMLNSCPEVMSSSACRPICSRGLNPYGLYQCYNGTFIELARCEDPDSPTVEWPGFRIDVVFTGLPITAADDPNQYIIDSGIASALKEALANQSDALEQEWMWLEARVKTRRLQEIGHDESDGRRLQTVDLIVTVTMAVRDTALVRTLVDRLMYLVDNPDVLRRLIEFAMERNCADTSRAKTDTTLCELPGPIAITPPRSILITFSRDELEGYKDADPRAPPTPPPRIPLLFPQDEDFNAGLAVGLSFGFVMAAAGGGMIIWWFFVKEHRVDPEEFNFPDDETVFDENHGLLTGYTKHECRTGVYQGQVVDGLRDGQGWAEWRNGRTYCGQWMQGTFHGHGLLLDEDGWMYNGQFRDGMRHGAGRCELVGQGSWYEGEWLHGLQHGIGELGDAGPSSTDKALARGDIQNLLTEEDATVVAPPSTSVWQMFQGKQRKSFVTNYLVPEGANLMKVELHAEIPDWAGVREKSGCLQGEFKELEPVLSYLGDGRPADGFSWWECPQRWNDCQKVAALWGIVVSHGNKWLSKRWGVLLITKIIEGGALDRWNQMVLEGKGKRGDMPVLVNSLIWRVNGVTGKSKALSEELCLSRRSVKIEVRNPAFSRFVAARDARHREESVVGSPIKEAWSEPGSGTVTPGVVSPQSSPVSRRQTGTMDGTSPSRPLPKPPKMPKAKAGWARALPKLPPVPPGPPQAHIPGAIEDGAVALPTLPALPPLPGLQHADVNAPQRQRLAVPSSASRRLSPDSPALSVRSFSSNNQSPKYHGVPAQPPRPPPTRPGGGVKPKTSLLATIKQAPTKPMPPNPKKPPPPPPGPHPQCDRPPASFQLPPQPVNVRMGLPPPPPTIPPPLSAMAEAARLARLAQMQQQQGSTASSMPTQGGPHIPPLPVLQPSQPPSGQPSAANSRAPSRTASAANRHRSR
eukprot:TRINITY_DN7403_c0_g2_i1.p1 TRINITY_DN7403_c0_g2~~TRINITY_DN7403_c0_g2_i1.p1  ORF type:complete len:2738 (+),score=375.77 TRINITY_DN7403_c0_g2_i1:179-8392(+)